MSQKTNRIRKELERRRRQYPMNTDRKMKAKPIANNDDRIDIDQSVFYSDPETSFHPLWNKEIFLMKILGSAILVLLVAIIYKSPSPFFDQAKASVKTAMETEFQFAAAGKWYEDKFGKPLALLPIKSNETNNLGSNEHGYALPVSGRVLTQFGDSGQGIILETGTGAEVKAMMGGTVKFAGKQQDTGKTVIIQHPDKSESWYGNLDEITVKTFEKVKAEKIIGTVSKGQDGITGEFYFAIKQNDEFIDPIQVIRFE